MKQQTHELEAFAAAARVLSFSKAAERIHITQSALSQRIQSLERALGLSLLIRDRKEVRLTEAGSRLLRYCTAMTHLESETLAELGDAPEGELGGLLRIAAYSTVMQSVIIPALAPLLRDNPLVRFEFATREVKDLPGMLERSEADFVVLDHRLARASVETVALGQERYNLIRSRKYKDRELYLDHDPDDTMTETFFRKQRRGSRTIRRCFLGDIQGVINGVELGLGRAVVPIHLLSQKNTVRIDSAFDSVEVPVILHYFRQPFYLRLQKAAIQAMLEGCPKHLSR